MVVPERIALGKKADEIIGTIANISYPSGEKDFLMSSPFLQQ